MIAFLIRTFSFFMKEIHDVRRQPLLLLSLVGGPLLVLAAFGLTFESSNPFITTVLVWPENGVPGFSQEEAEKFVSSNFQLVETLSDRDEALAMLEDGSVDVVQIIPAMNENLVDPASRPEIQLYSRTVDPMVEMWTRSLAYGEVNYINKQLLGFEASQAQEKAVEVSTELGSAQEELDDLNQDVNPEKLARAETIVTELRTELTDLVEVLPPLSYAQANLAPELTQVYRDLHVLLDDLNELEAVLGDDDLAMKIERLQSASSEIGNLRSSLDTFVDVPSDILITPIKESYTNLRGEPYPLVIFYAPAVLALLIQQLAITLSSLGLVRERQMGSFEMFRVSPTRFSEILIGKSLAYVLYVTIVGLLLAVLLTLIKVPLPVYPVEFITVIIATAVASVGIGSLISTLARTDSQAVQMTMLVLLMSIFFTGFFLPIEGFRWPARLIWLMLPMTRAMEGFKDLLLVGISTHNPSSGVWIGLGLIILVTYSLVFLLMRAQYRKVLG